MHVSQTAELIALGLTIGVHILGVGVLIWGMMDPDGERPKGWWRDWWPRDDDGPDPAPEPSGPRGGGIVPDLSDVRPASVRLREGGHIGDAKPRPARRPEHAPERTPAPARERETV